MFTNWKPADAKFRLPELAHGLVPDSGGTARLFQMCGHGLVTDLVFTGRTLEADEALRHGIVSRLVAREQLDDEALDPIHHRLEEIVGFTELNEHPAVPALALARAVQRLQELLRVRPGSPISEALQLRRHSAGPPCGKARRAFEASLNCLRIGIGSRTMNFALLLSPMMQPNAQVSPERAAWA